MEQDQFPRHPESLVVMGRLQEAIKAVPELERLSNTALVELGEVLAGASYDLEQALERVDKELKRRGLQANDEEVVDGEI